MIVHEEQGVDAVLLGEHVVVRQRAFKVGALVAEVAVARM